MQVGQRVRKKGGEGAGKVGVVVKKKGDKIKVKKETGDAHWMLQAAANFEPWFAAVAPSPDAPIHALMGAMVIGGAAAAPLPPPAAGGGAGAPAAGDLSKFIVPGKAIVVGSLADATAGIGSLLLGGADDQQLHEYALEGVVAIEREFRQSDSAEDRSNFAKVRAGTYGDGKTLGALMAHASTRVAKLQDYHVLALRLYTTSSYAAINGPMRTTPPTRPHPFAATTYFINEGIKKLRHVEATTPAGMQPRTLYRGVHGLALTADFMAQSGTEFACMSTSASETTAAEFAKAGQNPMLFKYDTKNCADRGADIAYLSVYAHEAEVLYPPLTFLRFKAVQKEQVGGVEVLVVSVDTQIVGN